MNIVNCHKRSACLLCLYLSFCLLARANHAFKNETNEASYFLTCIQQMNNVLNTTSAGLVLPTASPSNFSLQDIGIGEEQSLELVQVNKKSDETISLFYARMQNKLLANIQAVNRRTTQMVDPEFIASETASETFLPPFPTYKVYPTLVGAETVETDAATSITPNIPAGNDGDLLIAAIGLDEDEPVNTPTGWTALTITQSGGDGTTLAVFYKTAVGATEAAPTFDGWATQGIVASVLRYKNVDATNPINAQGVDNNGSGGNAISPSVTTTSDTTLLVRITATDNRVTFNNTGNPSNVDTLIVSLFDRFNTLGIAQSEQQNAGASGTATWSQGNKWVSATIALTPEEIPFCAASTGCLGGIAYHDFNANGIYERLVDIALEDIVVNIYDSDNILVGTVTTDEYGNWELCSLTDGAAYRIEYTLPASIDGKLKPLFAGTDNGTDVQFITAPACTKFGLGSPFTNCDENELTVFTSCYIQGDTTGTNGDEDVFVGFPYGATGTTAPTSHVAFRDMGSVWGAAVNPVTEVIFTAAFLKRHMQVGPSGLGGIYAIDYTGSPTTLPVTPLITIPSADSVLTSPRDFDHDPEAFPLVGKVGFGDIDISSDFSTLYAVNLKTKQIEVIDISTYNNTNDPNDVVLGTPIDIPEISGTCEMRPFGLKYYQGKLYVGSVCANEVTADVRCYNLSTSTWSNITGLTNFDISFDRGYLFANHDQCNHWEPWRDTWTFVDNGTFECFPQPMLSDIEFDNDGSMIIGFADRSGHQLGPDNFSIDTNDNDTYRGIGAGDVMRAGLINGTYVLESGGQVNGSGGCGLTNDTDYPNGQGRNGGEYYCQETLSGHHETFLGGIAMLEGSTGFIGSVMDPISTHSGGVQKFNNANGTSYDHYQLYIGSSEPFFGKGSGLGDVELFCPIDRNPLEIGNYVWCDSIENGIQDAFENGIDDMIVQLYDADGDLIGQDTTVNGQYFFNQNNVDTTGISVTAGVASPNNAWSGMDYSTQYYIVFGNGQFTGGAFNIGGETYSGVTPTVNAGSNDRIDSDVDGSNLTSGSIGARPDGLPFIDMTTAATGCGEYSYDMGILCTAPCDLQVSYTQTGCVDNTDGTFTTTYDLEVTWSGPLPSGDITLTHYGDGNLSTTTISAATISGGSSTTLSGALTVPADGNGNTGILAFFATETTCKDSIGFKAPIPCPTDVATCSSTANCIGGNAFEDFNCNGADDTNEPGVQGVQVVIYDCENNPTDTVWTDSDGDWQVCGLTDGEAYRVEFILPEAIACWATPTHSGSDNGTDVQFLTAPACTKFSLSNPADYCQNDPQLSVPCYLNGDPLPGGSSSGALDWMVVFDYDNTGNSDGGAYDAPQVKVSGEVIGPTWGMAYHKTSETLLASALMKRHSGFGTGGTGAIYQIDPATGNASLLVNLNSFTNVNTGNDTRDGSADNSIPTDETLPSIDLDAFAAVGKIGLGDLDISEDGQTLYTINLHEKTLVEIPVGPTLTAPASVNTYDIETALVNLFSGTEACGSAEDLRPWGLGINKGILYVGAVCSGQSSGLVTDLQAYIIGLDLNNTGNGFFKVHTFALDFDRENLYLTPSSTDPAVDGNWHPWADTWADVRDKGSFPTHPSPIFSDIEFDADGSMVLGFLDRFGHQIGYNNYRPESGATSTLYYGITGGDILRLCNTSSGYVLECTDNGTGHASYSIAEFYPNEFNFFGSNQHSEMSMGGVAVNKVSGELVLSVMNPRPSDSNAGGVETWNSATGAVLNDYELYDHGTVPGPSNGSTGKAHGLGDMMMLCDPAPLEIGNYVWCDSIENGIQDACERGINDLIVRLYDADNQLVGQDTTVNGNYYFNQYNVDTSGITVDLAGVATPNNSWSGLDYDADYHIVFGFGQFSHSSGEFTIGSDTYDGFTTANAGSNDNIDSDVTAASYILAVGSKPGFFPVIEMTTSVTGCGDHKYDMGILCPPCPDLTCGSISINGNTTTPLSLTMDSTEFINNGTWGDHPAGLIAKKTGRYEIAQGGASYYTATTDNNFDIEIPACADGNTPKIKAAYLTWMSRCFNCGINANFDNQLKLEVNSGATQIITADDEYLASGDWTNESNLSFTGEFHHGYTDVTAAIANQVITGTNNFRVYEFSTPTGQSSSHGSQNFGIGLMIIYECEEYDLRDIALSAGQDFIMCSPGEDPSDPSTLTNPGQFSTEICVEFPASASARTLTLNGLFGGQANSSAPFRGHQLKYLTGSGIVPSNNGAQPPAGIIANDPGALDAAAPNTIWESSLGTEWDSLYTNLTIPPGDTWLCIQGWSVESGGSAKCMSGNVLAPAFSMPSSCQDTIYRLCESTGEQVVLLADATYSNVVWYNDDGTQVGTGTSLTVTDATTGMADNRSSFFYTAESETGCFIELCCPVEITACICHEVTELISQREICSGESVDTLAALITFENPDSIAFVYFPTAQTVAATIYSSGTGIDTIQIESGNDTVRIFDVNGFTNTSIEPDSFFVYAIAYPIPASADCRPFEEILVIVNACDWGDLPDTSATTNISDYQTQRENNGPVHIIDPAIHLGSSVDGENNGQESNDALGDDIDEDGLTIFPSLDIRPGGTIRLPLSYTNTTGSPAQLEAWMDWNANGEFDVGEMVYDETDPSLGYLEFTAPNNAVTGEFLGLRIRISNHNDMTPYGLIDGGEVEDYLIGLDCPIQICLPVVSEINREEE